MTKNCWLNSPSIWSTLKRIKVLSISRSVLIISHVLYHYIISNTSIPLLLPCIPLVIGHLEWLCHVMITCRPRSKCYWPIGTLVFVVCCCCCCYCVFWSRHGQFSRSQPPNSLALCACVLFRLDSRFFIFQTQCCIEIISCAMAGYFF